ncbi:capsular polysaccharide export protein, LipB/KpsS family [Psychrobacter sp. AOP22-C1-22]|uniref:capsular polysaccharide export protein, LipB/KpsS family n=1 Tax=unclassified Psychrobacter TaxID=196806 RepID=UPI001787867D|nr:hypothetical protein [Psychrobacter sp. FME6]MBE0405686.1 hypothetical protein [Psychrobacter sp. FME6]
MSKLTKLAKNPSLFFLDSFKKRIKQINSSLNGDDYLLDNKHKSKTNDRAKGSNKSGYEIESKQSALKSLSILKPDYSFEEGKEAYLYLPWIKSHGDAVIQSINKSKNFKIYPLQLFDGYGEVNRKNISRFSREDPAQYRKFLLSHLAVIKKDIQGVIFTFDWHPAMRILVNACNDLGIKTILVLHESVFLSQEKYYMYKLGAYEINLPKCDHIITWGQLQKDIFIERGIDENRIEVLGAPKFDIYNNYESLTSRKDFCMIYGLDPNKNIFLYALQPMDIQVDQGYALQRQNQALLDIIDYCERNDSQLIMREPPSNNKNTIFRRTKDKVEADERLVIDKSGSYLLPVAENLYHADLLLSVNSTLILEALLSDTPVVSTKYFDFTQMWDGMKIPVAHNKDELFDRIDEVLTSNASLESIDWSWAEKSLSAGRFDGQASTRITKYLEVLSNSENLEENEKVEPFNSHIKYLANSNPDLIKNTGLYLPELLNFSEMIKPRNEIEASLCDEVIQWGITESNNKKPVSKLMNSFGKKPFIIEDGFIRSVGIGLSKEPALSITLCGSNTAYYDSYKASSFEKILNSDRLFTDEELLKAKNSIKLITDNHISKYNDSPHLPVSIGRDSARKVLVVDQRYGDQSVVCAKANENDFQRMLIDAIQDNPEADIIIKRHPDAVKGAKGSYFSDENVEFTRDINNVYLIDYDIHPHQLLEIVDKVYVCSSGLGFEALLYNKEVICYGVPFYSNWGITTDKIVEDRRIKNRTIEEVFYISYIECSRYYSPDLERVCDIDDCINYIIKYRNI